MTDTKGPLETAAAARSLANRRAIARTEPDPVLPGAHNPHWDFSKSHDPHAPPKVQQQQPVGALTRPPILRNRIEDAVTDCAWRVQLKRDETYADACSPRFLGDKADLLKPGQVVRIVGHELSFWAQRVVVRSDEKLSAVWTAELFFVDLSAQIAASDMFDLALARIEESGGGFRVMVGHNVASDGHATRRAAETWLARRAKGPTADFDGSEPAPKT